MPHGRNKAKGKENGNNKSRTTYKKETANSTANASGAGGEVGHPDQAEQELLPPQVMPSAHPTGDVAEHLCQDPQGAEGREQNIGSEEDHVECCVPSGCEVKNVISVKEPGDAVKVICNNENCNQSVWMHLDCFNLWEESVLSFLRSCGRARSWSEKQRLQNLWTKKGYDLAYKACDCLCGKGHLRKDLDYFAKPIPAVTKKKHKKGSALPTLTVSSKGHHTQVLSNLSHTSSNLPHQRERVGSFGSAHYREQVNNGNHVTHRDTHSTRDRSNSFGAYTNASRPLVMIPTAQRNHHCSTASMTSTGSSPPNSMDSPSSSSPSTPCTPLFGRPNNLGRKSKFDFVTDTGVHISGSMFKKRESLSAFGCLSSHNRNPYHIKMEDDGPHGNDETRNFLMAHLSSYQATSVHCLLCRCTMPVFDRYPLIDGTFFLSPVSYDEMVNFPVERENKSLYLHAVCIFCLEGAVRLLCQFCNRDWNGSNLVLGTMYSYDIFAAHTCCDKRFSCKNCAAPVKNAYACLLYFSEFSQRVQCPNCKSEDFHFVKPLQDIFYAQSICN